jgi:Cu/Ag efflux protein CusF
LRQRSGLLRSVLFPLGAFWCLVNGPACGDSRQEVTYEVRGEVVGLRFQGAALRIRHEAIPGYMEAMTMDFRLRDPGSAQNLRPGDKIRFRYVVAGDDAWAEDFELLPPDTSLALPDTAAEGSTSDSKPAAPQHEH